MHHHIRNGQYGTHTRHIYDRIPKVENLHMDHLTKLEDITRKLIHVKIKASRIRTRSLTSNTKWKIYLGLDPKIAPEVIAWNYGAKVLERDMLLLIEAVAQHRFETRLMGIGLQIVASQS
ncbi:40S ribosomal protein S6 [Paramarasmius palmivorus]|uniref:40S ribosomal protein S6 n=1 Tax=Paramarasmius palmivorus TaxID=297713 RepID=A0AAW0C839_9AGAR